MAHGRSRSVIEIEGKEIILLLCWYLFMFFFFYDHRTNEETASELRRRCNAFFMELVSDSVLMTQCQRTLKRKLSLYLCVMLSVISQLRPRISLHSLIMLLIPLL